MIRHEAPVEKTKEGTVSCSAGNGADVIASRNGESIHANG